MKGNGILRHFFAGRANWRVPNVVRFFCRQPETQKQSTVSAKKADPINSNEDCNIVTFEITDEDSPCQAFEVSYVVVLLNIMAQETTPLITPSVEPTESSPLSQEQIDYERLLPYHILRDVILLTKSSSELQHTDNTVSRTSQFKGGKLRSVMSRRCTRLVTNAFFTFLLRVSTYGLILLSFIEPPSWCRGFSDGDDNPYNGCEYALNLEGTPLFYSDDTEDPVQDLYPNTGTMFLTLKQSLMLEWVFLSFIALHTLLSIGRDSFSLRNYFALHPYQRSDFDELTAKNVKVIRIVRFFRVISLLLLLKGLLAFSILEYQRPFAVYLRMILFITYAYGILRELIIAVEVVPSVLSVMVVLLLVNTFYGLIGVAAFSGTQEGEMYFSNLIEGMWTLWTSMTTVIYPVSTSAR